MAIIPTDAALGPLPSGRSGAQIVSIDDPGRIGRAVAQLGQSMEGAAAQLAQSWEQNDGVDDEAKFQAFQNERMLEVEKLTTDTTPEQARGLTLGYINDTYKPAAKQFLDSISPKNRAAYTSKLINLQGTTFKSVYGFEEKSQGLASTNLVKSTLTDHSLPRVARYGAEIADPKIKAQNLDATLREFKGIIDTLPYSVSAADRQSLLTQGELQIRKQFYDSLPPEEKVKVAENYGFKASDLTSAPAGQGSTGAGGGFLSRGQNLSQNVGSAIDAAAAANGVDPKLMRAIAAIESSGNPRAVTGSNKGLFQLSDDIFTKYGKGGDIFDPAANANAAAAELADFQKNFIAKNGRPATAGEIYLYHQQGVAGAPALLANPTKVAWQAVRQFYGSDAIAKSAIWGNIADADKARFGSVENVTAGDFTNYWKQKVEGGVASAPSPYNFSGINPEYILTSAERAQAELEQAYRARLQADKVAASQAVDAERGRIELSIRDHKPVNVDADIRNNDLLPDKTKAELINMYESENAKQIEQQRIIERFTNPNESINGFSNKDNSDANAFYDAVGGSKGLDKLDPEATSRLDGFVTRYGIVPKSAVEAIVAGINSQSEETRTAHLAFLNGLYRRDKAAFERDFPQSAVETAHAYEDLVKVLPLPEVVSALDPRGDRATKTNLKESIVQAEKVFKDIPTNEIIDRGWDTYAIGDQPNDPAVGGVLNQFRREFGEAFARGWNIKPDKEFAMSYATRNLKQRWGGSNVGSENEFMKYPPENNYPKVGDSHDWMKAQLKARVERDFPGFQSYHLVATNATESTLSQNAKQLSPKQLADPEFPKGTVYNVVVVGANGEYGVVKNFWFDPNPAIEAERAEFTRRNQLDLENRKVHQRVLDETNIFPARPPGDLERSAVKDLGGTPGTVAPGGAVISPYRAAPAFRSIPSTQAQPAPSTAPVLSPRSGSPVIPGITLPEAPVGAPQIFNDRFQPNDIMPRAIR